jgi:hypothetical protein
MSFVQREPDFSWDRLRRIFGNPTPPRLVTESQFDYMNNKLNKLAATPYEEMDFRQLIYYYEDLAFVELQPEVFQYLFPACLMHWHQSLQDNQACTAIGMDFHLCIRLGNVFDKMLSKKQLDDVNSFFADSFLFRLDKEVNLTSLTSSFSKFTCLFRLNSLACIAPITNIWRAWWSLSTVGRARAALKYINEFLFYDEPSPFMNRYWLRMGNGTYGFDRVDLWEIECNTDLQWRAENVAFLKEVLTIDFLVDRLSAIVDLYSNDSEAGAIATLLKTELYARTEIVQHRIDELPRIFAREGLDEWSL